MTLCTCHEASVLSIHFKCSILAIAMTFMVVLVFMICFALCKAGDVTIYMNDSRLVTVPPDLWSNPDVYTFPICGYLRFMNGTGQSVSLSFTGELVTVNFYPYVDGSIAQVTLDGENVTRVDTYNLSGIGSTGYACAPMPWTSDLLPQGQHTITVTELEPNGAISIGLVPMLSFVYKTAVNTSTSTPYPGASPSGSTTSSHNSTANAGAIAGGVVGGIMVLLIIGAFFARRRWKQKNRPMPSFDLIDESPVGMTAPQSAAGGAPPSANMEQLPHVYSAGDDPSRIRSQPGLTPFPLLPESPPAPSSPSSRPQSMTKQQTLPTPPQPIAISRPSNQPSGTTAPSTPTPPPPSALANDVLTLAGPHPQYTPSQLTLFKTLADAHTDGSIVAAVARGINAHNHASSSGSSSGNRGIVGRDESKFLAAQRAEAEAEVGLGPGAREAGDGDLQMSDIALLQGLSDSGADGVVIRRVVESMVSRRGGEAPPGYDDINGILQRVS